jgi:spore coat protein JB
MNDDLELNDVLDTLDTRNMDYCEENDYTRDELLMKIKSYNFAVIELGLYLNTHPDDEKALCLHNAYTKKLKDLKDKYQKVYGPLSIYYPCNKWRWLEQPWPWEGGNS